MALSPVPPANATTFLPVTFNDLIGQSDVIFVGEVADVHPFAVRTREGTIVKTRVTFRVTDPLSGDPSIVEVFDFLGGEADGIGLTISGMPTFAVGGSDSFPSHAMMRHRPRAPCTLRATI